MENTIWEFLKGVIDPGQAMVLLALILANLFTGTFASMITGTFEASRLWEFAKRTGVIFSAYIGVGIVAQVLTDWSGAQTVIYAFAIAFLGDKIFKNLNEAGLPVPAGIPLLNRMGNLPAKLRKQNK